MADDYAIPDSLLRRFADDLANRFLAYQDALASAVIVVFQGKCGYVNPTDDYTALRRIEFAKKTDAEFLERWKEYRR
jgi:hypothetical protein